MTTSNGRIHTLEELAGLCARARAEGKTIAHCHGAFDLLHPGHVQHLQAAGRMADVLVVTLTQDRFLRKGPGRPVFNESLRARTVAAIKGVDHVATCASPTGVEAIERIKPDLYVKGQEYRDRRKDVTGAIVDEERAVRRHGGRLAFTDEIQFSSSKLLNQHFGLFNDEQRAYLRRLKEEFSAADVLARLDALRSIPVLVVGEAILDEYHYCTPDAMSNKSPTLSVRYESAEVFAGGVIAVGHHLGGFCERVQILAGAGDDGADHAARVSQVKGDRVDHEAPISHAGDNPRDRQALLSHATDGVETRLIIRPGAPTVRKRRFVHRFLNQKLFEVTFLDDRPIPPQTEAQFLAAIDELAPKAGLVIVADFGHGYLTPAVVRRLRERSRFLAVNAQINSSNRGFNSIRKYAGADYISVDEYEIRLPFGDRYGPLREVVKKLSEETGCRRINVTLGDKGTLYYDGRSYTAAPVLTDRVVDTIGAGDALLALTSLMVCAKAPSPLVPFIGNCMGGLMTQIVGHRRPVDAVDLRRFVETLLK